MILRALACSAIVVVLLAGCSTITNPVGYFEATKDFTVLLTIQDYPDDPLWHDGSPEPNDEKRKRQLANAFGVALWPIVVPVFAVLIAIVGPDNLGYERD